MQTTETVINLNDAKSFSYDSVGKAIGAIGKDKVLALVNTNTSGADKTETVLLVTYDANLLPNRPALCCCLFVNREPIAHNYTFSCDDVSDLIDTLLWDILSDRLDLELHLQPFKKFQDMMGVVYDVTHDVREFSC